VQQFLEFVKYSLETKAENNPFAGVKGTVSEISSDLPCNDGNGSF